MNPLWKKILPFSTFLLFGGISIFLWYTQIRHERELVMRHVETSSEQMRIRIEGLMNARMACLASLADRWVERVPPDFSRKRFVSFAQMFYSHYPGFLGINWMDPGGVIRWVFPQNPNQIAAGRLVADLQAGAAALRLPLDRMAAMPCAELAQGGTGYNVFLPLNYEAGRQGYLNGVFRIRQIVDISLARDVFEDFWIRLYEADRLIYANDPPLPHSAPTAETEWAQRTVQFPGKTWRLALAPKEIPCPFGSAWQTVLLVFGIGVAAILAMLLHFLLERMQRYRLARDQALQEIIERKRTQKALVENKQKLESALAEIDTKNTELETFVYTVSHDLKTPIVTIEGFIGALREDYGHLLDANADQYLDFMSEAAQKMELLINDLLYLSRIGRLPQRIVTFSLGDLTRSVLTTLQPQIGEKGILVQVQEDLPMISGDMERLAQVMENLLSNAVKYIGHDNPSPRIDVGFEKREGRTLFFVRDNGIGIEETFYTKIFEIFQRLPAGKKAGEGTGVGLTIVKRIIENHGGRIWVDSVSGKGTTFYFTLKNKE